MENAAALGTGEVGAEAQGLLAEIDEELDHHFSLLVDELVAAGRCPVDAYREAERRFGPRAVLRKACLRQRNSNQIMIQRINTVLLVCLVGAVVWLGLQNRAVVAQSSLTQRALIERLEAFETRAVKAEMPRWASSGNETPPDERAKHAPPANSDAYAGKAVLALDAAILRFLKSPDAEGMNAVRAHGVAAIPGLADVLAGRRGASSTRASINRMMAANLLGETGDAAAVEPLLLGLGDSFFNVRRCSASALGKIDDAETLPRVVAALEALVAEDPYVYWDPTTGAERPLVREDAANALKAILGGF